MDDKWFRLIREHYADVAAGKSLYRFNKERLNAIEGVLDALETLIESQNKNGFDLEVMPRVLPDMEDMCSIEIRGFFWEFDANISEVLYKIATLADSVSFLVGDDGRFVYSFEFGRILISKK